MRASCSGHSSQVLILEIHVNQRPQRVFHSILASHVILNVRKASYRGELTHGETTTTSAMRFRERLEESVEIMGLKLEVDELTERLTNEEAEIADLRAKQRSLRDELAVLLREKKKLVKRAAAERNIIKEGLMAYDRMKELHTCLKKLLNY